MDAGLVALGLASFRRFFSRSEQQSVRTPRRKPPAGKARQPQRTPRSPSYTRCERPWRSPDLTSNGVKNDKGDDAPYIATRRLSFIHAGRAHSGAGVHAVQVKTARVYGDSRNANFHNPHCGSPTSNGRVDRAHAIRCVDTSTEAHVVRPAIEDGYSSTVLQELQAYRIYHKCVASTPRSARGETSSKFVSCVRGVERGGPNALTAFSRKTRTSSRDALRHGKIH
jgi:hypothetical protein